MKARFVKTLAGAAVLVMAGFRYGVYVSTRGVEQAQEAVNKAIGACAQWEQVHAQDVRLRERYQAAFETQQETITKLLASQRFLLGELKIDTAKFFDDHGLPKPEELNFERIPAGLPAKLPARRLD